MSGHTPEPWVARETQVLGDGTLIAGFIGRSSNARRIVACVNACRGMSDPAAEIAKLRADLHNADERIKELEKLAEQPSPHGWRTLPPEGYVLCPDGVARKVLGTWWLTDDGCILAHGYEGPLYRQPICGDVERRWPSVVVNNIDPEYRWFSTREAAEAARSKGEK